MMFNIHQTPEDSRRYADWKAFLLRRGASIPTINDFLAYGSLSTLERLRSLLAELEPENVGPIRLAIASLRAKKTAKAGSKAKGGRRGPALACSIPKADLPLPWKGTIRKLRMRLENKMAGGIDFDNELKAMPKSSLDDAEYILRAIAKSSMNRGKEPSLTVQGIVYWIDDAEARGCGPRGLSCQIGILNRFLLHHEGTASELAKILGKLRRDYIKRGDLTDKRKDSVALADFDDLGEVWLRAKALLEEAQKAPHGTFRRYKLHLEAAAIALSVVVPLRIGDLHRIEIGTHLKRDASGWQLSIKTQKTGGYYHRDKLWPKLTQFLDALIIEDAPGRDFWIGYRGRVGTPVFSRDGGATGLSGDWISDIWFEHFGVGAHFVRTLWHENVFDADDEREWIALSLCGQRSDKTAKEYRRKATERRRQIKGRGAMSRRRCRLQNVDIGL
ncbi:hypothetical protein FDK21_11735 [Cohaesibacter sp. CAU 1516]|uniref:hypothetical protein n=1 Tax=Cohaesibacter sp. CAU 1516 TaxID=2576038 RepID=UPI0010FE3087|nr:hypothetical protein [Cohaesibacter sp. CAU 1516]TLP45427.1 hypothetical protein FDK21_11735 [Cohaesibacter sp. CAU 1516]